MRKPLSIFLFVMMALSFLSAPLVYHYSQGNLSSTILPDKARTDAVMVFTGSADRTIRGYQFYLMGWAERLMITGDDYQNEIRVPKLRNLSKRANKNDVTIDLKATNTIENAENGAAWAIQNKVKSILLITTEGHMPRAYFELRRLLPDDIKIYTKPVPGEVHHAGMDSERGRLLCRLYETATGTSFCYETRELIQGLTGILHPPSLPKASEKPELRLQPDDILTDLSAVII